MKLQLTVRKRLRAKYARAFKKNDLELAEAGAKSTSTSSRKKSSNSALRLMITDGNRRYSAVPHSGFGARFERLIQFATGIETIAM